MSEQITGAQSLIKSLEAAGRREHLRHPRRRDPPGVRPAHGLHRSGTSWCATSRAPGTPPRGTPPRPARWASAWRPPGPGATNLVTPIADAHMDSVPMVAVTGQVGASMIGTDAFQEADIRGITMPITKHNFLVTDPAEIPRTVAEAFYIASTGRPGPVLVDVAKSALQAQTTFDWPDRAAPARLPAGDPPALQADPRGRPADPRVAPPGALRRRRHDPRRRLARAARCSPSSPACRSSPR